MRKSLSIFSRKKIHFYDTVLLFRQLAVLIGAGISITDSFEILSKKQEKIHLKNLLLTIKYKLESGKKLVESVSAYPQHFDELSLSLLEIGEHTGQLDTMLIKIAESKEKKWKLRQEIKTVLFYPLFIFFISLIISLIMLVYIVPRFEELFINFQRQLPALTLGVFLISKWVRNFFWLAILLLFLGLGGMNYYKKTLKNFLENIMQKAPILKNIIQKILLARFAHNLGVTISSGIAITDALKIMLNTKPNFYAYAIKRLHVEISKGQQVYKAMATHTFFSPLMIQMVKVGEETGKLDYMLEKIAILYEAEITQWLLHFSRLLEPLIMLILGVLIGGLVIAMYLPIFKLGTVMNGHY